MVCRFICEWFVAVSFLTLGSIGCGPKPRVDGPPAPQERNPLDPFGFAAAEWKPDPENEKRLAAQHEEFLAKMAATEDQYLPSLSKFKTRDSHGYPSISVTQQPYGFNRKAVFAPTPILAITTNRGIEIWDLKTAELKFVLDRTSPCGLDLVFSQDGQWMLVLCSDGESRIQIWNVEKGTLAHTLNREYFCGGGFASDGKTVYTTQGDFAYATNAAFKMHSLDLTTGELKKEVVLRRGPRPPRKVVFSADGSKMACAIVTDAQAGTRGRVYVMRTSDGAVIRQQQLSHDSVKFAFSPDGWRLAIGVISLAASDLPSYRRVLDWDLRADRFHELLTINGGKEAIAPLAPEVVYSADGKFVYFADLFDRGLNIWDVAQKKVVLEREKLTLFPFAVSPGGRLFSNSGTLYETSTLVKAK